MESEVDILFNELPQVFDPSQVPEDWDEEWVIVPIDEPDELHLGETVVPDPIIELYGEDPVRAENTDVGARIPEVATLGFPGAYQNKRGQESPYPPPDAFAFYLPLHYFYPTWWGIYLTHEGILEMGRILQQNARGTLDRIEVLETARIFLFGHEQFHHEMESFATRLEVTHRSPLYRIGFEVLYRQTYGTDDCLEEALANAHGVRRVLASFRRDKAKKAAVKQALRAYVQGCPPGYRRGFEFVTTPAYEKGRNDLAERAHRAALPHIKSTGWVLWRSFPRAFHPFRTRNGRVNFLIQRNTPLGNHLALKGRYLRYREVVRQLVNVARCRFVREGKGSHEIWQAPNGNTFPVPRHPGDLARGTLAKIIKQAGLSMSVSEFMAASPVA